MEVDSPPETELKDRNSVDGSEDQQTTDGDSDATASEPDDHAVDQEKTDERKKKQGDSTTAQEAKRLLKPPSPPPSRHTKPLATRSQRSAYKAPIKPPALADAGSETDSDDEL